jgi:hypothetical protein
MPQSSDEIMSGPPRDEYTPTAHIANSLEYALEAARRWRRVRVNRSSLVAVWLLWTGFCAFIVSVTNWGFEQKVVSVVVLSLFMLVNVSGKAAEWQVRQAFKKSPYGGVETTIEFSEHGVRFHSTTEDSIIRWGTFLSVIHFPDGFLLLRKDNLAHWIPKASVDGREWGALQNLLDDFVDAHRFIGCRNFRTDAVAK